MKSTEFVKYLLIMFLFFSCAKKAEQLLLSGQTTTLQSRFIIKNLDSTTLTITMDPVVTCYSYRNGETPKPCDIFITITCELSRPLKGTIKIEVEKRNQQEIHPGSEGQPISPAMVLSMMHNTTRSIFKTTLSNPDTQNVSDLIQVSNITVYSLVN